MNEATIDRIKEEFQFIKPELRDRKRFDEFAEHIMNATTVGQQVFSNHETRLELEESRLRIQNLDRALKSLTKEDIRQLLASPPDKPYDEFHIREVQNMIDCFFATTPHDKGIRIKRGKAQGFKVPAESNNEVILFWILEGIFNEFVKAKITKGLGISTSFFHTALNLIEPERFKSLDAARDWVKEYLRQKPEKPTIWPDFDSTA